MLNGFGEIMLVSVVRLRSSFPRPWRRTMLRRALPESRSPVKGESPGRFPHSRGSQVSTRTLASAAAAKF